MALSQVSPSHPDAVTTVYETLQDEYRIDPSGTHDPDHPDVGWILDP